jgi:hypothetical protein
MTFTFIFSSLMIKFGIAFNGASIFFRFHDRILLLYLYHYGWGRGLGWVAGPWVRG